MTLRELAQKKNDAASTGRVRDPQGSNAASSEPAVIAVHRGRFSAARSGRAPAGDGKPDRHDPDVPAARPRPGTGVGASQPSPRWEPGDDPGQYDPHCVARVLAAWDAAVTDSTIPDPRPAERDAAGPVPGLVTLRGLAWRKSQREQAARVPGGYCITCWTRWSRALWPTCCICTGDVTQSFTSPS